MLISVIIPTYNRWKHLKRAVNSVLQQTFRELECIIIDDCSTHREYTKEKLSDDPRVTIIRLEQNQRRKYNSAHAQGLTRNEGIKISTGEYIAFLDDDDWWEPNKLALQLMEIKAQNVKMCSSNTYFHRGQQRRLYFSPNKKIPKIITGKINERVNLIINSSVIIKKDLLEKVGGFHLVKYEDYELWKRVMQLTDCAYIQTPLVHYDGDHGGKVYYHDTDS